MCFEVTSVLLEQYLIFLPMPVFNSSLGTIFWRRYYTIEQNYIVLRLKCWKTETYNKLQNLV